MLGLYSEAVHRVTVLIEDNVIFLRCEMMKRMTALALICMMTLLIAGCSGNTKAVDLTWHQCPEAVRNYLSYIADHPYSPDDRSYTYINDKGFATESNRSNTKPVGITVDDKTFYDAEPNKPVPFSTSKSSGTLTALDPLRWFNTTYRVKNTDGHTGEYYDVGDNCRDLGGWKCDGGTVKYGMLVRSGELNPDDKELMVDQIGIKTEVSLLPISEQVSRSSAWGIDWVGNPTDIDFKYRIDDPVKDQWKLYLHAIFESVANKKPVVFHCGAGADKTGTMAVMLMGILGCSEQDIDTDYELTTFIHHTTWRNRTFPDYINYINGIKNVPLADGLSDSFRNRCISFALSVGITTDEINAFRSACINGSPDVIVSDHNSFPIENNLSFAENSNSMQSVAKMQAYEATITAEKGYTLTGALISISMGDEDASKYYSDGRISIPSVSGPLVITVDAFPEGMDNLFKESEASDKARIRSIGELAESSDDQLVTGFIDAAAGDTIYYASDKSAIQNDYDGSIGLYDSKGAFITLLLRNQNMTDGWHWAKSSKMGFITIPSSYTDTKGVKHDLSKTAKVRICIPYTDKNNIYVYRLDTPPALK